MISRRFLFSLAVCALLATSVSGAVPTIDQLLSMESVARPRISPDGRLVVYEKTQTDWKENAYVAQLWIADTASGRTFQLTRGKKAANSAEWSPDGRWIAFLTERESGAIEPLKDGRSDEAKKSEAEKKTEEPKKPEPKPEARQIWLISPQGGEAWMLTRHGAPIDSFRWSEDGKQIAFNAPLPESKANKDRKEKYGDYQLFEEDYDQNRLWVVDVAAAEKTSLPADARQITNDSSVNVEEIDWSPDGTKIAFTGTANPLLAYQGTEDVYIADLARGNAVTKAVALEGPDSNPHFSPDGTELAFNSSLGNEHYYYTNIHVAAVRVADVMKKPATHAGDVRDLTSGFDEEAQLAEWNRAGLYFFGAQKTSSHLFRIDPHTGSISRVTSPDAFYLDDVSFSRNADLAAFLAAGRQHLREVFVEPVGATLDSANAKRLTDMTSQIAGMTLGTPEIVSWKSSDGTMIEGVLQKPANYDPKKKYPLLVVIHGGPTGVSRPVLAPAGRYYPIELFLAKGALVLQPNYRGSAGYGEAFRSLNVRNLGVGDMWDVMSGVDALVERGIADPNRLGAMGWSQGGYISAFLTTNTDRFKAVSVGAGISDWTTYYVNTDITPFTRMYLHATPWDDPEVYAKTSPMTNIRKAKTPTLIQHGEKDRRVPPPNAFELYRGLRDVGVPAKLVVYAGYGHGITKPKSNRAVLQHNLDWFSHWIWGEPIPPDSPLVGSGEAK